jgi:hypothetical protein
MGITINLVIAILAVTFVAIDISTFFLLVRVASLLWPAKLLLAFDATGRTLTEYYLRATERLWGRLTKKQVTEKQKLLIGLCLLLLIRLVLSAFGQLLTA